ncbi:phosphatidylethanolamine N-methyltransferase [Blastocladiella emersonii ATCC 22665]|nr:phosphatidylethanolamine N-methyltransferase [Blastocladiella emersonii ATCC 22665]
MSAAPPSTAAATATADPTGLRQRHPAAHESTPPHASTTERAATPEPADDKPLDGVTANGTTFEMPKTSDMLTSVFGNLRPRVSSPSGRVPQSNAFDHITLAVLAAQIAVFFLVPVPRVFFLFLFLFWRVAYNVGLGWLLKHQSDEGWLIRQVNDHGLFDANKNPAAHAFFKREFEKKMGFTYQFDAMPVEFNAWLLFRSIVDLVLINDFGTYCIFFVAYWDTSSYSFGFTDLLRVVGGLLIVVFNLWVKVDAHRVVKDFAWYWGDFFFLLNNPSLTFDGVFEMAPHPMYSVGYAGYYGVSLITGSYTVLYVSLVAHLGQLAFLTVVENPHIFKTYGKDRHLPHHIFSNPQYVRVFRNYFSRDLVGLFRNMDVCRSPDLFTLIIGAYALLAGLFGTPGFATAQAMAWIVFHTGILGAVLYQQSRTKAWTRHFIRFGATNKDAFEHWKAIYNLSIAMLYVSFGVAAWKNYSIPADWTVQTVALRHVLGSVLILLHIWTSMSVFEVLGDFGYFFGDFFIDRTELPSDLFYTGIYRFVNNPEKIMGHAAFWGIALMAGSWTMFALALVSQLANFVFLQTVEEPHMTRLYGSRVRKESGLAKLVRERVVPRVAPLLPPPVSDALPRTLERATSTISGILASSSQAVVGVAGESTSALAVSAASASSSVAAAVTKLPPRTSLDAYALAVVGGPTFAFGQPVTVEFRVPAGHAGRRDWIALYRVNGAGETTQRLAVTPVSSHGHWKYLNNAQAAPAQPVSAPTVPSSAGVPVVAGKVTFEDAALVWTPGVYEARLHFDESHTVVAVSDPFTVVLELPGSDDVVVRPPSPAATDDEAADDDITPEHLNPDPTPAQLAALLRLSYGSLPLPSPNLAETDLADIPDPVARRLLAAIRSLYAVDFHRAALAQFGGIDTLATKVAEARIALYAAARASANSRARSVSPRQVGARERSATEEEGDDAVPSPGHSGEE